MRHKGKRKTTILEGRCDVKALATITKYYYERMDDLPETRSGLLRYIVEDMADMITSVFDVEKFVSTASAVAYLEQAGLSGKGKTRHAEQSNRMALNQIQKENIASEGFKGNQVSLIEEALNRLDGDVDDFGLPTGKDCDVCGGHIFRYADGISRCNAGHTPQ